MKRQASMKNPSASPIALQGLVGLRALRSRKGYALRRQRSKLMNDNGWCFWQGQIWLLDKLIASLAQPNVEPSGSGD
jgi:hypothetical protein